MTVRCSLSLSLSLFLSLSLSLSLALFLSLSLFFLLMIALKIIRTIRSSTASTIARAPARIARETHTNQTTILNHRRVSLGLGREGERRMNDTRGEDSLCSSLRREGPSATFKIAQSQFAEGRETAIIMIMIMVVMGSRGEPIDR